MQHLESIHQFLIDGNYCCGRNSGQPLSFAARLTKQSPLSPVVFTLTLRSVFVWGDSGCPRGFFFLGEHSLLVLERIALMEDVFSIFFLFCGVKGGTWKQKTHSWSNLLGYSVRDFQEKHEKLTCPAHLKVGAWTVFGKLQQSHPYSKCHRARSYLRVELLPLNPNSFISSLK